MSMVIGAATPNFVVLSGDNRASKTDGTVIGDTFIKIFQVNSKILIGFTGDAAAIEIFQKSDFFMQPNDVDIRDYVNQLYTAFKTLKGKVSANIIILGKTPQKTGWIAFFNIDSGFLNINRELVFDGEIIPMCPTDSDVSSMELRDKLVKEMENIMNDSPSFVVSCNNIAQLEKNTIRDFSKKSKFVSASSDTYYIFFN